MLPDHVEQGAPFRYGVKLAEGDEEKKPSFLRRYAAPIAGLTAAAVTAPLAYRYLHKQELSANPSLRAMQEASRGKFTRVVNRPDPGTWQGRLLDRVRYAGGGNVHYQGVAPAGGPMQVPGVVRHHGASGRAHITGDVDVGLNDKLTDMPNHRNKMDEFNYFNKHTPGSMGTSKPMGDVLREMGYTPSTFPKDDEGRAELLKKLQTHLAKTHPNGFVLKDTDGFQSGGAFPSEKHDFVDLYSGYNQRGLGKKFEAPTGDNDELNARMRELQQDPYFGGRVFNKLFTSPKDGVMVQEKLPIAQLSGWRAGLNQLLGAKNPSREYRVHVENGVATPQLTTGRFDPLSAIFDRKGHVEAATHAQGIVDKLPVSARTGTFGMDVAPMVGGGHRLIESNPSGQSGMLLNDPRMAINSHKHYTGQHSKLVSGLGAGGAAMGAGVMASRLGGLAEPDEEKTPRFTP